MVMKNMTITTMRKGVIVAFTQSSINLCPSPDTVHPLSISSLNDRVNWNLSLSLYLCWSFSMAYVYFKLCLSWVLAPPFPVPTRKMRTKMWGMKLSLELARCPQKVQRGGSAAAHPKSKWVLLKVCHWHQGWGTTNDDAIRLIMKPSVKKPKKLATFFSLKHKHLGSQHNKTMQLTTLNKHETKNW